MPGSSTLVMGLVASVLAWAEPVAPRVVDPRLQLTLVAEHPQLVTPTGIDVDARGRVWVIESNTHFPPDCYAGHPSDRLLILRDADDTGRAQKVSVFADGLKHAMSVAVRPDWFDVAPPSLSDQQYSRPQGQVYVATRREILLLIDDDGDLRADRRETLISLDTPGDYPHNGLAGFALDPAGWLYFGFGENLGAAYKISDVEGVTLTGGAEGGNVYRCRPDGTQLSQWSTGFWNPHASCVDAFGQLFSVDNDPDSRPPCRLLHLVPGGDYGYRFRNGRKGLHPFTAWNGEIPGTLPMVGGTGEAPSGIVAYEAENLPAEYHGTLLVGSWGDHRIDRFRLQPRGASYTALAEPIVVGGEEFRPVGLAVGPDGALYFSDWVSRDYKLHGKGRVWKLSAITAPASSPAPHKTTAATSLTEHAQQLESPTLTLRRQAAEALASSAAGRTLLIEWLANAEHSERSRLEGLWALIRACQRDPQRADWKFPQRTAPRPNTPVNIDHVQIGLRWLLSDPPPGTADFLKQLDQFLAPESVLKYAVNDFAARYRLAAQYRTPWAGQIPEDVLPKKLTAGANPVDPFLLSALCDQLARAKPLELLQSEPLRTDYQQALVIALRRSAPRELSMATACVPFPDPVAQRLLAQWIAEERLAELRPHLESKLQDPRLTADLFLAVTAALEMLDGKAPQDFDKTPASKYVLPLVMNDNESPAQAVALRLVDPADPALTAEFFRKLLGKSQPQLGTETIRTLQWASIPEAEDLLRTVAADQKRSDLDRAEAVLGLARFNAAAAPESATRQLLTQLLSDGPAPVRVEALRAWRGTTQRAALPEPLVKLATGTLDPETSEQLRILAGTHAETWFPEVTAPRRPQAPADWLAAVQTAEGGVPAIEAGRRTFVHPQGPGCYKCHTIDGRGGRLGPDLSTIARTMSREKLADSILRPSTEIAPQFVQWTLELTSGKTVTGVLLSLEQEKLRLGLADGQILEIPAGEIEGRTPQPTSLMPEKLIEQLTQQEFFQLVRFLESLK